ncbi:MAG: hypothetical protein J5507_06970 [Clostridia bacterium]|nr:hypothetical protein [Clostridia bacterium]
MKKNGEYVGVDDKYIPEDEKYVDDSLLGDKQINQENVKKVAKKIGIGYLIFIGLIIAVPICIMIFFGIRFNNYFNKSKNMFNEVLDKTTSQTEKSQSMINKAEEDFQEKLNKQKEQANKIEADSFNKNFESYSGTTYKLFLTTLLDNVATNNKKNSDKLITVVYNTTTTSNPDEIIDLKQSFEEGKKYESILDYDSNGLVNKVTIKDL